MALILETCKILYSLLLLLADSGLDDPSAIEQANRGLKPTTHCLYDDQIGLEGSVKLEDRPQGGREERPCQHSYQSW